jgi:hypothetical protein
MSLFLYFITKNVKLISLNLGSDGQYRMMLFKFNFSSNIPTFTLSTNQTESDVSKSAHHF